MLSDLTIKNFAIIDDLSIHFPQGLTILSGETGAGKSIIINAVNLLLGNRATSKMIRTGAETAEIEALFNISPNSEAFNLLSENGYEPNEELLIRRIISRKERHRVYINGRLATMTVLNRITENLAAISGQHEHQRLLKESQHLLILDQFGDLMALREQLHRCYHEILPMLQNLERLKSKRAKQNDHIELLNFQKKEIEDAEILTDEDEMLSREVSRLKNSELLHQTISGSINTLYSSDGAIIERLGEIRKEIEKISAIDSELIHFIDVLADATYRIEDVTERLRSYTGNIVFDQRRIEEIETRLELLNMLKRKYGGTIDSILKQLVQIDQQRSKIKNLSEEVSETENRLKEKHDRLIKLSADLSKKRKKAAGRLSKKIVTELKSLKMRKIQFDVAFSKYPPTQHTSPYLSENGNTITETGAESAIFMISPNIGEELKPLSSIASGGELSRVILALKSIMVDSDTTQTMIFDEVDAGIGGEAAEIVGEKLSTLSCYNQVICITHLAQIAKFGHHHFKISKVVKNGRTCTQMAALSETDRLEETARMIGGAQITKTTRAHAKELLKSGQTYRLSKTD